MFNTTRPLRRAKATNHSGGFTALIPTVIEPIGDGVHHLSFESVLVPCLMKVWGLGLGADNDAFTMRVYAWNHVPAATSATRDLWVPTLIGSIGFIVSAAVGVAGTMVPATERFADTVTIISGGEGTLTADVTRTGTIITHSPTNDLIGYAILPLDGAEKIQFDFDDTTNNPTMNALWALL